MTEEEGHKAYGWALTYVCDLTLDLGSDPGTTEEDWWALLRTVWKAKLGLDPSKPQVINGKYVDV